MSYFVVVAAREPNGWLEKCVHWIFSPVQYACVRVEVVVWVDYKMCKRFDTLSSRKIVQRKTHFHRGTMSSAQTKPSEWASTVCLFQWMIDGNDTIMNFKYNKSHLPTSFSVLPHILFLLLNLLCFFFFIKWKWTFHGTGSRCTLALRGQIACLACISLSNVNKHERIFIWWQCWMAAGCP